MPAGDPTSPLENLRWACASTATIVGNVRRDELAQPTPCRDWTVADLINHIVGATQYFGDLAESGASPDDEEWPAYTDGDYVTLLHRAHAPPARWLLDSDGDGACHATADFPITGIACHPGCDRRNLCPRLGSCARDGPADA